MVSANEIRAARDRIRDQAHVTPLLSFQTLGRLAGGRVHLKAESLQRAGAFKFRGALNAVRSLTPEELASGVTTYSSGNHGQALALAAQIAGGRAVIFMPEDAPAEKVAAARAYGAEVRFAGTTSTQRRIACEEAAAKDGLSIVPPFDDPRIVAGQATVGLEILEQHPEVEEVLVPVGGGGLIAGIAAAIGDRVKVVGVEPVGSDAMRRALEAGGPVDIPPPTTVADGLKPLRVGELNYRIAAERVASVITVDDDEIRRAMRLLLTRARLVVEPSGAVGVAALMSGRHPLEGRDVVIVLSGGNVSGRLIADVLAQPDER